MNSREVLRALSPRSSSPRAEEAGSPEAVWVFLSEGEYWTIAGGGHLFHLRNSRGLQYLHHLLLHPGRHLPATEITAILDPAAPNRPNALERTRSAVTKRIKEAIGKIAARHPVIGYHLGSAVKTGRSCIYLPDPEGRIRWKLL